MRGAGPVGWGGETIYTYFTVSGSVTRVRVSLDEAYHLDVVEGLRVTVRLPGQEPTDGLVARVRHEPPFVWVELTPVVALAESRAG
jgi:hypothetical protein